MAVRMDVFDVCGDDSLLDMIVEEDVVRSTASLEISDGTPIEDLWLSSALRVIGENIS